MCHTSDLRDGTYPINANRYRGAVINNLLGHDCTVWPDTVQTTSSVVFPSTSAHTAPPISAE